MVINDEARLRAVIFIYKKALLRATKIIHVTPYLELWRSKFFKTKFEIAHKTLNGSYRRTYVFDWWRFYSRGVTYIRWSKIYTYHQRSYAVNVFNKFKRYFWNAVNLQWQNCHISIIIWLTAVNLAFSRLYASVKFLYISMSCKINLGKFPFQSRHDTFRIWEE